ncbi:MFS transporter [Paraburkholderia sp.]|uniref:MFS transporter n=1 Tax=Paraburkholderia sp. TaxID=1926495 RepID=UPI0039E3D9BB
MDTDKRTCAAYPDTSGIGGNRHRVPRAIGSEIAALMLAFAVLITGNGLLGTLVALRMVHSDFSPIVVGLVQTAYYLGFMIGAWWHGSTITRIGHHRAFATFAALASCTALGYAVSIQPLVWACLRFMTGFCLVGIFTVVESRLNSVAPNAWRGRIFSLYLITTYLCVGAGQFLIGAADPYGFELFSLVTGLFAASLVPLVPLMSVTLAHRQPAPADVPPKASTLRSGLAGVRILRRVAPLGLWGCFAAGLLNSVFYALYPVYMRGAGYSVEAVSHFMGFALIATLLPQWPVARLADRFDRRRIMLAVSVALCVSSAVLFLRGDRWLQPLAYLFVSLLFSMYGLSISHANDRLPPAHRVPASAALLLAFALGGSVGPLAASFVMTWAGPRGIYAFTMSVTAVLTLLILRSLSARHRQHWPSPDSA